MEHFNHPSPSRILQIVPKRIHKFFTSLSKAKYAAPTGLVRGVSWFLVSCLLGVSAYQTVSRTLWDKFQTQIAPSEKAIERVIQEKGFSKVNHSHTIYSVKKQFSHPIPGSLWLAPSGHYLVFWKEDDLGVDFVLYALQTRMDVTTLKSEDWQPLGSRWQGLQGLILFTPPPVENSRLRPPRPSGAYFKDPRQLTF